jgi:hypothetical protein
MNTSRWAILRVPGSCNPSIGLIVFWTRDGTERFVDPARVSGYEHRRDIRRCVQHVQHEGHLVPGPKLHMFHTPPRVRVAQGDVQLVKSTLFHIMKQNEKWFFLAMVNVES